MRKHLLTSIAASALVLAGSITSAKAVATVTLFDGTTTVTVADGSALDLNGPSGPANGVINWSGVVGVWIVNVTTGITKPVLGDALRPHMDLNSVDVSSAAGDLWITLSDDFFGPLSQGTMLAQIGGTAGGTLTYETFLDPLNVIPAGGLPVTSQTFGSGAFSGTENGPGAPQSYPYSLTQVVHIKHAGGVLSSSFNASLTVPDGGSTLMLLGSALSALVFFARSRKAHKA